MFSQQLTPSSSWGVGGLTSINEPNYNRKCSLWDKKAVRIQNVDFWIYKTFTTHLKWIGFFIYYYLIQEFRRSQEPIDRSSYTTSYYNLLKEYLNPVVKAEFPHAWEELEIRENETERYPGLTISYKHSTIFLAPMSHCDPIQYLYDDNLAKKTINAHHWMNSYETDLGCIGDQIYDKGVRYFMINLSNLLQQLSKLPSHKTNIWITKYLVLCICGGTGALSNLVCTETHFITM